MKTFQTAGACSPRDNYMVDLSSRLKAIRAMVDQGLYFTITRARQYGKTTTLNALRSFLADTYDVLSLDFQRIVELLRGQEGPPMKTWKVHAGIAARQRREVTNTCVSFR